VTPSATTAAGRAGNPRPTRAPSEPGHRRTTRPGPSPRGPRRPSGPARGRTARAPAPKPSLPARGVLAIRGLPEHALLDRIIRGRAWIPLLGVLLVGIVAMQVEILKLGAGMGRWIQRTTTLQTRNQALQASVAGLMDEQRIERLAAKMGMLIPDPTALSFLSARPGSDAARAAANVHPPDPSNFSSQLPALSTAPPGPTTTSGSSATTATSAAAGVSPSQSSGSNGG
jgi:hypothetical protein